MIPRIAAVLLFVTAGATQQASRPPDMILTNDLLELTILGTGGTFSKLLLRDGEPVSPLASIGHFLALDGFGAPSEQERAAGMPFHGEASKQAVKVIASQNSGPVRSLTLQTLLPLAQESLTRKVEMVEGEQVVYVTSDLESGMAVDRPFSWAEHATIGPPFLEKGKTVVDMPALNCRVRPFKPGAIPGRLAYERDFQWPLAPTKDNGQADLRLVPADNNYLDLASCQMDPKRKLAFVTALHLDKHLLFGYVFRRQDYPWLMSWMNYTGDSRAARGMEFSTQPFDISHRETVAMSPLFGTPTFRWLPAKARLQTRFLLFYARAPEGFTRVDDVVLEGGKLTIVDRSGLRLVLPASREL
ncbi:MAG: hypothetical protein P4L56_13880 [Candidatus Sulfopaludibacter sp.]|nr:hypothetical protein [Candidatus Sulfopaludibacter sp.]